MSGLERKTDSSRTLSRVRKVPTRDSCTAAAGLLFDHFVGAGEQRLGNIMLVELLFRQSNSLRFPGLAGGARLGGAAVAREKQKQCAIPQAGQPVLIRMNLEGWRSLRILAAETDATLNALADRGLYYLLKKHGKKQTVENPLAD